MQTLRNKLLHDIIDKEKQLFHWNLEKLFVDYYDPIRNKNRDTFLKYLKFLKLVVIQPCLRKRLSFIYVDLTIFILTFQLVSFLDIRKKCIKKLSKKNPSK